MASNSDIDRKNLIKVKLIDTHGHGNTDDIDNIDDLDDSFEPVVRNGKRFEIEKITENTILLPIDSSNQRNINDTCDSNNYSIRSKSSLKKTCKKYEHDDSFDQRDLDVDREVKTSTDYRPDGDNDDAEKPGCLKMNYDRKNKLESVTLVLKTSKGGLNEDGSKKRFYSGILTFNFYKRLIAEYLGTMLLVLYVCGIGLPISEKNGVPSINGCLGGGLTLGTIVWCLGNVSGGHINPAISIAFLFSGKISLIVTFFYVGFQLLGGLSGAFILKSIIPDESLINATVTKVHQELTPVQGVGIEFIITFILALTVFACVDSKRKDLHGSFPLSIGLAIVVGGLFGGPFTGGSMNPARSFGPAVASGIWDNHWVYWVGPIAGGVSAGLLYTFILTSTCFKPRRNVHKARL